MPLIGRVERSFVEQRLAHRVVELVEAVDGDEVLIDDVIQQPVQQERNAVAGEGSGTIPTLHQWIDREPVVLPDRDDPAGVDERVDLGFVQFPAVGVEAQGVDRQELVGVVVVEFGALMRSERVLDSEFMQRQLVCEHEELVAVGFAEVDPHDDVRVGVEVLGDVGDRKVLRDQESCPPGAGAGCDDVGGRRG